MAAPRHILIISYHFGDSGETGGFRWAGLVRLMAARGWTFHVLTASQPGVFAPVPGVDVTHVPPTQWPQRLGGLLPRVLRVMRAPLRRHTQAVEQEQTESTKAGGSGETARRMYIWQPGSRVSVRTRLARNYGALLGFLSDVDWSLRAGRIGSALARREAALAVIVSSPPHFTQLAGRRVAKATGVPYVADYRDPWIATTPELREWISDVNRIAGGIAERWTQSAATVVVHNNAPSRDRASNSARLPRRPRISIPNGYDGRPVPSFPDQTRFRVLFAGWLHPYMDPRPLFAAFSKLIDARGLSPSNARLEFMGAPTEHGGVSLAEAAADFGLADFAEFRPRGTRQEALEASQRAAALVAFDTPHPLAIANKFYDYLLVRGELILLASRDSALDQAARLIGKAAIPPHDTAAITDALDRAFMRWRAGEFDSVHDPELVHSRSRRADDFEALLLSLTDRKDAVHGQR